MKAEKLTLYLNKEELKKFFYLKNKNKLSFSTIIDILVVVIYTKVIYGKKNIYLAQEIETEQVLNQEC